jgi:vitamin B12 transporter
VPAVPLDSSRAARPAPRRIAPQQSPPGRGSRAPGLRWIVALLVALAPAAPAAAGSGATPGTAPGAATPAPTGPAYDVYVTEDQDVVERIGPRRVVDRKQIEERNARTLDEALDFEPGVYVRLANEGIPRIDLRGQRPRQVLLLLDGIPFNSTDDGQFDPSLITTEGIQRIKVSFGNSSVLYGEGPMAGVIGIQTLRTETGLHGSAGLDFRSENQDLGRFSVSDTRGQMDFLAAGSGFYRHGFPLSDSFDPTPIENGGRRDNSIRDRENLLARIGWTPSDTLRIGALVNLVNGSYGVPPNVYGVAGDPFAQRTNYERVLDQHGGSGQLSMQWDPHGPLQVRSWFYVNQLDQSTRRYDSDSYDSMADPTVPGTFREDGQSRNSGGAMHIDYDLQRAGRIRMAFESKREDFDNRGVIRDVRLGKGMFGLRDFDDAFHQSVYSAGLEYEVRPLHGTGLVVGYDHSWLDKDQGRNDNGPVLLAGAFWDPHPGTHLRGSVSHRIRFPSLSQLYDANGGNADLKAEQEWDYEVGFSQELPGRTLLDVTGFYTDFRDFIQRDQTTNQFVNNDRYLFKGVEVTLDAHPLDALEIRASYSFLLSDNRSHGVAEHHLQNRPEHHTSLEARYRLPYGFALRGALEYVADQVVYTRQPPTRDRGTGDYVIVDLRLAKTFQDSRYTVYFGVDNVADENYQQSYGVPQAGRVFLGGVDARF